MNLAALTSSEKRQLITLLEEKERRVSRRKLLSYYPDEGPLRRELYPKHLEFFAAGVSHRERLMLAANRVGKTEGIGGYELTLHLTGRYPDWWQGRRFKEPIEAWMAGKTNETTRDIVQRKTLGTICYEGDRKRVTGTGLIPGDDIGEITWKQGVQDLIDTVKIKHVSGGWSILGVKSYQQGRGSFEGTEKHVVWLDEEPPVDIYSECLIRTMTVSGIVMLTFTPLEGMSEVVLAFLPGGQVTATGEQSASKYVVMCTWDEVPHLTAEQKKELWESIPPYQRDARAKGVPQLGSGAIYPVPESDFVVEPFELPSYWPRAYGFDVGWNRTAAIWGAHDREADVVYLYTEHYRGQAEPSVHADAIKARGIWMPGAIDPAARGRAQKDGQQLFQNYIDLGLDIYKAENGVEAGLFDVYQRLSTGRLKVFSTCQNWLTEFRLYRRNDKGAVVKENDHLMDATRYLIVTGIGIAITNPDAYRSPDEYDHDGPHTSRSSYSGY